MYYTDSTYRIGRTHDDCEDYACHNNSTIAISDGCSNSPDTNIGALVIARHFLTTPKIPEDLADLVGISAMTRSTTQIVTGKNSRANDATLMGAKIVQDLVGNISIQATVIGDGVIIHGVEDMIFFRTIEFDKNAPAYLSYLTNGGLEYYLKNSDNAAGNETIRTYDKEFKLIKEQVNKFEAYRDAFDEWNIPFECYEMSEPDFFILASDGLTSLRKKEGRKKVMVTEVEILKELLDVKLGPNFMRRRVTAMLENTGWEHTDDLSVAAFWKKGTGQ